VSRIALFDPINLNYDIDTAYTKPLGGTQSALCYLAAALAQLGHDVTLMNKTETPGRSRNVNCVNFTQSPNIDFPSYDFIIIVNFASAPLVHYVRSAAGARPRIILWSQHAPDQQEVNDLADIGARDAWDGFVLVSDWQAHGYSQVFGIQPQRITILRNAISPAFENLYAEPETIASRKPWPPVLCYTSTPFRGLDVLLDAFPRIRAAIPGATLKVYSSMGVYGVAAQNDEYAPLYERCRATEGVEYVGSLPQPALVRELLNATCLAYPNTFAETSCISVMEALAAGCIVITSRLGALPETTAGFGHLILPLPDKQRHAEAFADFAVGVLEKSRTASAEHAQRLEKQVRHVAQTGTWAVRAREWHEWLASLINRAPAIAKSSERCNADTAQKG
jgi:glycosyltransferase involved in cell wall biosynthesis